MLFQACFLAFGALAAGLNGTSGTGHVTLDFVVDRDHLSDYLRVVPENSDFAVVSGEIYTDLRDFRTWYLTSIYVGSNSKKLDVWLDLSNPSFYFLPNITCAETGCLRYGFDPADSETYQQSSPVGDEDDYFYGTDDISFETEEGPLTIPEIGFGFASDDYFNTSYPSPIGVLGMGAMDNTSSDFQDIRKGLPEILIENGLIEKSVYSIFFNSSDSKSGTVLFGAVDHAKYSGQLVTNARVQSYIKMDTLDPMFFEISSMDLTNEDASQNVTVTPIAFYAVFSLSMYSEFPQPIFESIVESLDAKCDDSNNCAVNCDYNTRSDFLNMNFPGTIVRVPLADIIFVYEEQCYLGLKGSDSMDHAELGDDVLKNAYVVFDLEREEVSIAPVRYSESKNIERIGEYVPSATRVDSIEESTFSDFSSFYSPAHFTAGQQASVSRTASSNNAVTTPSSINSAESNTGSSVPASTSGGQSTSSSTGKGSTNSAFFSIVYGMMSVMMLFAF